MYLLSPRLHGLSTEFGQDSLYLSGSAHNGWSVGDVELLSICHALLNSDKYLLCQTFRSIHVRTITACKIASAFSFLIIHTSACNFPS